MTTDGATIKSISENVVVKPGEEAKLSCAVDGKFVSESFLYYNFRFMIVGREGNWRALREEIPSKKLLETF